MSPPIHKLPQPLQYHQQRLIRQLHITSARNGVRGGDPDEAPACEVGWGFEGIVPCPQLPIPVRFQMRSDSGLRGQDRAAEGGAGDRVRWVAGHAEQECGVGDYVGPVFDRGEGCS